MRIHDAADFFELPNCHGQAPTLVHLVEFLKQRALE
jgi:hypothetical protein